MSKRRNKPRDSEYSSRWLEILDTVTNVLIIPVLVLSVICSIVMINAKRNNSVPNLFGYSLVTILSESMLDSGFEVDDTVMVKKEDAEEIKVGDIIAYYRYIETSGDVKSLAKKAEAEEKIEVTEASYLNGNSPNYSKVSSWRLYFNKVFANLTYTATEASERAIRANSTIIFHQVVDVVEYQNALWFRTWGTSNIDGNGNPQYDSYWIKEDYVVGKYTNTSSVVRSFLGFASTNTGIIWMVEVPSGIQLILSTLELIEIIDMMSRLKHDQIARGTYVDRSVYRRMMRERRKLIASGTIDVNTYKRFYAPYENYDIKNQDRDVLKTSININGPPRDDGDWNAYGQTLGRGQPYRDGPYGRNGPPWNNKDGTPSGKNGPPYATYKTNGREGPPPKWDDSGGRNGPPWTDSGGRGAPPWSDSGGGSGRNGPPWNNKDGPPNGRNGPPPWNDSGGRNGPPWNDSGGGGGSGRNGPPWNNKDGPPNGRNGPPPWNDSGGRNGPPWNDSGGGGGNGRNGPPVYDSGGNYSTQNTATRSLTQYEKSLRALKPRGDAGNEREFEDRNTRFRKVIDGVKSKVIKNAKKGSAYIRGKNEIALSFAEINELGFMYEWTNFYILSDVRMTNDGDFLTPSKRNSIYLIDKKTKKQYSLNTLGVVKSVSCGLIHTESGIYKVLIKPDGVTYEKIEINPDYNVVCAMQDIFGNIYIGITNGPSEEEVKTTSDGKRVSLWNRNALLALGDNKRLYFITMDGSFDLDRGKITDLKVLSEDGSLVAVKPTKLSKTVHFVDSYDKYKFIYYNGSYLCLDSGYKFFNVNTKETFELPKNAWQLSENEVAITLSDGNLYKMKALDLINAIAQGADINLIQHKVLLFENVNETTLKGNNLEFTATNSEKRFVIPLNEEYLARAHLKPDKS